MTNKFKVGDKVIPVSKSVCGGLDSSIEWKASKEQGFMYIVEDDHYKYTCSRDNNVDQEGDYFLASDLIPHTEDIKIEALEKDIKEMKTPDIITTVPEQPFDPPTINFSDRHNNTIGTLYFEDDTMNFKGDVHKSARVLFEYVCSLWNDKGMAEC